MNSMMQQYATTQFPYSNITSWQNAGWKGKGINILNCEPDGSETHSSLTFQTIEGVAPESTIFRRGLAFVSDANSVSRHELSNGDGTYVDIEEFIKTNKIKLLSFSMQGTQEPSQCVKDYWMDLQKKYGIIIFNSAGNDATHTGTPFSFETAMQIGAVNLARGVVSIANYSSIGEEVDFVQFTLGNSGTSFSCPYQAGMTAMILDRYGLDMGFQEMYKYLQMISKDFGDVGHDVSYGWGLPILPQLSKKYIRMIIGNKNIYVDDKIITTDVAPIIDSKTGRTLVPLRVISETLGAIVTFDSATQTAKLIKGSKTILIKVNSSVMIVNGVSVQLDATAKYDVTGTRLLVPVRAISEAFGCKVDWVQSAQKVIILEV